MPSVPLLFLNVFVVATCGLIYELLAGTLASYVLGDSVKQFSLIIGIYLFSMGIGAWVSKLIDRSLARAFLEVELAVALLGGFSAPVLFLSYGWLAHFPILLYLVVGLIGILVGLELPLLMRILQDQLNFKDLVARVLMFDYIGALAASILFPMLLVPYLGLVRTSLIFGLLNAGVAFWGTWLLEPLLGQGVNILRLRCVVVLGLLLIGLIKADFLTTLAEEGQFQDRIVYSHTSSYQRIIVTANAEGFHLYLNGHLQFASIDEYRYHEALVHPAMMTATPKRVLVLGGGDGLGLREVLKYSSVKHVTLVDLDPAMTSLSKDYPRLGELNKHAFDDARVEVVNADAMIWLEQTKSEPYDVAIIDFPDPRTFSLGKLYTTRFYHLLKTRLTEEASIGIQCSSPLFARKSYWCIIRTLEASGFRVRPYHASVPTFGEWGFAVAKRSPFPIPSRIPVEARFLNDPMLPSLFLFPTDMTPVPVEVNRLNNQVLVRYHDLDWKQFQ